MRRAVCVGINDYRSGEYDLYGCVNDALDMAAVLQEYGYTVTLLLDREATRERILDVISREIGSMRSRADRFVLTQSGHGSQVPDTAGDEPDRLDEVFCCAHIFSDPGDYIADDEYAALFGGRTAGRAFFISDSCHSRSLNRAVFIGRAGPEHAGVTMRRRVKYLSPDQFLGPNVRHRPDTPPRVRAVSQRYASVFFSGCADDGFAYDAWFGTRPNGAFTRALLGTLLPGQTWRAWEKRVQALLPSKDYPQEPKLDAGCWQKYLWHVFE